MTFRALALRQSVWRRANARNVSFILITVGNLHFQLSWYNQITLVFRNTTNVSPIRTSRWFYCTCNSQIEAKYYITLFTSTKWIIVSYKFCTQLINKSIAKKSLMSFVQPVGGVSWISCIKERCTWTRTPEIKWKR